MRTGRNGPSWRSARGSQIGGTQGDCTGDADLADVTQCGAAALLDQSRIAGVGNVFRAECCMGCGCSRLVRPTCATSCSERRDLTTGVCYRTGADGPLGRRSGCWYGRRLSSCQRLRTVCAACRSSGIHLLAGRWHARYPGRGVVSTGRRLSRVGLLLVGRGSWESMPLAARQTAIPGWPPGAPRLARRHLGRRDLGPGRRGRRPVGIVCQVVDPDGMGMDVTGMLGSQGSGPGL
jgi:hypothetical protein